MCCHLLRGRLAGFLLKSKSGKYQFLPFKEENETHTLSFRVLDDGSPQIDELRMLQDVRPLKLKLEDLEFTAWNLMNGLDNCSAR